MRKMMIKLAAASVLTALLIYGSGAQSEIAATSATKTTNHVKIQAQKWVNELAAQPGFEMWDKAELHIAALGPGLHSWLVHVKKQQQWVGYMVIHATMDGSYQLGEYGTGQYPLFDNETLQRSISQLELMKPVKELSIKYSHPLMAVWRIEGADRNIYYTDGFTGEELPLTDKLWTSTEKLELNKYLQGLISDSSTLVQQASLDGFDPYERMPWLTKSPIQINNEAEQVLIPLLDKKVQLRYTAERYEGKMLYVWSVAGYHIWSGGERHLALASSEDSAERRYISLSILSELGSFYR